MTNEKAVFDFNKDSKNYVVQSNALVNGRQSLKLNSAKLIRSAIMQVVAEDTELKPYVVKITELARLIEISPSNMYRDIQEIIDDITENPVYVKEESNGVLKKYIKIPWVARCEYEEGTGIIIKLNEELKPYLLNLKKHYTQYQLGEVLCMRSVYSIRIFELIFSRIMNGSVPKRGCKVVISIEELRACCDCLDKYPVFANFRERVIETAVKEINQKTFYSLEYNYIKKGKKVESIEFNIIPFYNKGRY